MSIGTDLVQAASEIYQLQAGPHTMEVLAAAGGVVVTETGKMVFRKIVEPTIDDLFDRFRKEQRAGKIPEGFEATSHGQKLMQDALNKLQEGLDEERAEAIKQVFLGLAKNPVTDSLQRIEQLHLLQITSGLEAWEVAFINVVERYRRKHFDGSTADQWEKATDSETKDRIKARVRNTEPEDQFHRWLLVTVCESDNARFRNLEQAFDSLKKKDICGGEYRVLSDASLPMVYRRNCPFTDIGAKLTFHLYSASDDRTK